MKKVYLVTEDGRSFEGYSFGADVETVGELVFNTGMVGYIETLTDPSYYGQILVQTFPLMGNYGIIPSDFEGKCYVKGLIVREWCNAPSNFRCEYDLDKFLKDNGVAGICGIDTREITKHIRENGVMNAKICAEIPESLEDIKNYSVTDAVSSVTCSEEKTYEPELSPKYNVTVVDYGVKKSFIDELLASAEGFAEQSGDDFNEVEYSNVEASEDESYVRSASNANDQPEETESVEITDEFLDEILSILEEAEHDENEG